MSRYPKAAVLCFTPWVGADIWKWHAEVWVDGAQEPGLGFLAFWNGAPRSLGSELGSGNRNKSPGNNYFPNAEAFYTCAGSEC